MLHCHLLRLCGLFTLLLVHQAAALSRPCLTVPAQFVEARALVGAACAPAAPHPLAIIQPLPASVTIALPAAPVRRVGQRRAESGVPPRGVPLSAAVRAVAAAHRIDPALLHAIVRAESGYRVDAVSSAGALGLLQVMPATARDLGVDDPERLTSDPLLALDTGARYLKQMQRRFGGRLPLVLASYNAGPGAVERHGGIPPYRETRQYVRRIMADYAQTRGVGL
jgi:soluble lytic murein transglycosylase-like protein